MCGRKFLTILSAALAIMVCGCAGTESLVMRSVTSPEGWSGNAFYRNGVIASEEFISGANGSAIDVWRYYDGYGRLYTEERDTFGLGIRTLYRDYNKDGELVLQKEDLDGDGTYDKVTDFRKKDKKETAVATKSPASNQTRLTSTAPRETTVPRQSRAAKLPKAPKAPKAARPARNNRNVAIARAPQTAPQSTAPTLSSQDDTPIAPPTARVPASNSAVGDNWIRPTTPPNTAYADSTNAASRIVPGPVFIHPSDGLEE